MELFIKAFIVGVSILVGVGTTLIFKMKPDNQIEEIAEEVLERQTGLDVDFSWDSEENSPIT